LNGGDAKKFDFSKKSNFWPYRERRGMKGLERR
jgi:hypothetical protein